MTATPEPTLPALGARDVLRIPAFRRMWLAQAISDMGDGLTLLTLMLLVNQLTGSTLALAAISIALTVPPLTIGLVAGTYADRFDRRRIMVVADVLRAIVVLGFIVIGSADLVPLLIALAFVQASIGTFFTPARGALMPRVVPERGLLAANSITQATRVIASVIGTALAGLIVGVAGITWPAFVLDGVTFLASAILVVGLAKDLGRPSTLSAPHGSTRGAVAEGLRLVAGSRVLWTTLLVVGVAMFGLGAVNVLFLPLIVDVLAVNPVWLGAVEFAQSASMILSATLIAVIAARLRPTTIVTITILGVGVLIALTGAAMSVGHVVILLFAVGWFVSPLQASVVTLMQTGVPDGARGRVMATLQASMSGASVGSMALAGLFGDLIGIREVFFAGGAIVVIGGLLAAVLYRGARQIDPIADVADETGDPDMPRPGTTPGLDERLAV